jgi:hypothetical protein
LERAKKISMKRKRERELIISTIQTSSARATEVSCVKVKARRVVLSILVLSLIAKRKRWRARDVTQ